MKKHIERIIVFIVACMCLMNFSFASIVNAQSPYYKIPKYENFEPNKAANEIETIVNRKSIIQSSAVDNKIYIDGAAVAQMNNDAVAEINDYINKLNNKGMYLTRELVNTVTVQIEEMNFSEFVEIVIDSDNLGKITDVNTLKVVFQNNDEYIALSKDTINGIAADYKDFRVQIKKLSDTYTVRFLDRDSNIISKYNIDIKIALPARHSEQTVYLFMNNTQENWGGQYNSVDGTMEFMTKYSGEYNVASPEIVIDDIDALTSYEQQAIRFMAVRSYFELDDNKFNPDMNLTRYDFAESLVRMFFALDSEAVCSFPDVDKKHYRYVAASEQSNIVQGFSDGTFRGQENVTAEQVLALAARTINQKNGYVYPENIAKYLNFASDNIISDWAEKEIALASREGIYSNEMNLKFVDGITRKDAAVVLYRLFMIMNNTPEGAEVVEYNADKPMYHETVWNKTNAIIVGSAVIAINGIALALSVFIIKKKRKG